MRTPVSLKPVLILNMEGLMLLMTLFLICQTAASPNETQPSIGSDSGVLTYQGTLLDSDVLPINGLTDSTFSIYDGSDSEVALWQENHTGENAMLIKNGLFNVLLGSPNPIPMSVWELPELYLGMTVGSDNGLTLRELISSVPNAASDGMAQMVSHRPGKNHNATFYENPITELMATDSSLSFFCDVACSMLIMYQGQVMRAEGAGALVALSKSMDRQ